MVTKKVPEHLNHAEKAYLELSDKYNFIKIECSKNGTPRPVEDINNEIFEVIEKVMK